MFVCMVVCLCMCSAHVMLLHNMFKDKGWPINKNCIEFVLFKNGMFYVFSFGDHTVTHN